jgi:hypothetical protein
MSSSTVNRGKLLGRGAFGFVFQGTCLSKTTGAKMNVAIKALQPVSPGQSATNSALIAYKVQL